MKKSFTPILRKLKDYCSRHWIIVWTVLFVTVGYLCFAIFQLERYTITGSNEGIFQKLWTFGYIKKFWIDIIHSISNGKFYIPQFDISIALGDSIIPTLNWGGFSDPLNLVSIVIPRMHQLYVNQLLMILRLYLGGLTFIWFCKLKGIRTWSSLCGALVFLFNGKSFFDLGVHVPFYNVYIQLPLLLIGIYKIKENGKKLVLILSVFYTALCGFYVLYMMTLAGVIYIVVDITVNRRNETVANTVRYCWNVAASYIMGTGLSAFIMLPLIIGYLDSARHGGVQHIYFFSNLKWYASSLILLISPDSYYFLCSISLICVFILMIKRDKDYRFLKIIGIILFVAYLVPAAGSVMNGFSYSTNRWFFFATFYSGFVTARILPELTELNIREKVGLFIFVCLIVIIAFINRPFRSNKYVLISLIMVLLSYATVMFIQQFYDKQYENVIIQRMAIFVGLIILNIGVYSYYYYSSDQFNRISAFVKDDQNIGSNISPMEDAFNDIKNSSEGVFRVDGSQLKTNIGMRYGMSTINTNWSIINKYVSDYLDKTDHGIVNYPSKFKSEQRTINSDLLGVRYQIENKKRDPYVPFGYSKIIAADKYDIYENRFALPVGYTYEKQLSYDTLDQMEPLERSEAMMKAIALDNTTDNIEFLNDFRTEYKVVDYSISDCKKAQWQNGELIVESKNGSIELSGEIPEGCEAYILLKGISIEESGKKYINVTVKSDMGVKRSVRITSSKDHWYHNSGYHYINVGYSDQKRNKIRIYLSDKGKFQLDDIEIFCRPMADIPLLISKLKNDKLENTVIENNHIKGDIDLEKPKILCLSVPYSRGWNAKVDGNSVDILRGNYMFMAIPLNSGKHKIDLEYKQPGLISGFMISGFFMLVIMLMTIREINSKREGID